MTDIADAAAHRAEVDQWHARRVAALTGPDGWLSVTGLFWLEPGETDVGSRGPVVLPAGPERIGAIEVVEGGPVVRLDAGAPVTDAGGRGLEGEVELLTDRQTGGPAVLRVGSASFYVIDREGRLAVRVKDSESPARRSFAGIDRYPVDLRWRVDACFEQHPPGATLLVPDVLGSAQTYRNPGSLRFDVDGRVCRLEAFQEPDEVELFVVFGDSTNGSGTFGGGRYLYAKPADDRGRVVLDFNRAYNPPCVFTEHATCVLPLKVNRLPVAIEAGEKRYGRH